MKRYLLISFLTILFCLPILNAQPTNKSFTIEANIVGYGNGTAIVSYNNPNQRIEPDTIAVRNDKFTFTKEIDYPIFMFVKIMNNGTLNRDYQVASALVEHASYTLNANVKNIRAMQIEGGVSNPLLKKMYSDAKPVSSKYVDAKNKYRKPETDSEKEKEQLKLNFDDARRDYINFLVNYDGFYSSHAGTYILSQLSSDIPAEELVPLISNFTPEVYGNPFYIYLKRKVDAYKRTLPGVMASDFLLKDLEGNSYTLESFKNSYLLMTFSASWCGPCKYEYPFILKAYEKYKEKGLQVIIINVDTERKLWEQFTNEYNFPFPVLSDLTAFSGELTKNYGVMSIPKVFLIAPSKEIISATIRQQKILDKLEEIYNY